MKKKPKAQRPGVGRVSEPVQVYLSDSDLARLERLTRKLDATKSDILRRGLLALEMQATAVPTRGEPRIPIPVSTSEPGLQPGVDLSDYKGLLDLMDGLDAPR